MVAFVIVTGFSGLMLVLLALPLLRLAWEALPLPSVHPGSAREPLASEAQVEAVVRERLYGRPAGQTSSTILPSLPPASNRS
jgi:hypothetical protein